MQVVVEAALDLVSALGWRRGSRTIVRFRTLVGGSASKDGPIGVRRIVGRASLVAGCVECPAGTEACANAEDHQRDEQRRHEGSEDRRGRLHRR